jgi:hypothetical protein
MLACLELSNQVKLGDLLTSISIIISLVGLLLSLSKDRRLRKKEHADRIRAAASKTLAKLQRWQELSLWLYQQAQPLYVETSEMLPKEYDVYKARDFLWRKLEEVRTSTLADVLKEQIEIAYVDLFAYYPDVYGLFTDTLTALKGLETEVFDHLITSTQAVVLSYAERKEGYRTEQLGNDLRGAAQRVQEEFKGRSQVALKPVSDSLVNLIGLGDDKILKKPILLGASGSKV